MVGVLLGVHRCMGFGADQCMPFVWAGLGDELWNVLGASSDRSFVLGFNDVMGPYVLMGPYRPMGPKPAAGRRALLQLGFAVGLFN